MVKHQLYSIFFLNLGIFLLFLLRNPFSSRTLIPNLEPFPDSIHYINPALSFLKGYGFNLERQGRIISPAVPPLYSMVLVPLFILYRNPRVFYLTNVVLSFLSLFLFFLIAKKLTKNLWIIGFCLFLFVTNYFFYWYPTLAMAENLILFLFLYGVYLLVSSISVKNTICAGFIAVSFYATKYASAPLTGAFFLMYFIKILFESKNNKDRCRRQLYFLTSFFCFLTLFFLYEQITKNSNIFFNIFDITKTYWKKIIQIFSFKSTHLSDVEKFSQTRAVFSQAHMGNNLPRYLKALTGEREVFLWDSTPIVSIFVPIPAYLGLIWGLFKKKTRILSFSLIFMIFLSVYFISSFYTFDMRYVYHAIPTLLLGFVLFLSQLESFSQKRFYKIFFYTAFFGLCLFYLLTNIIRFKKQIMLNLKYSETPWYYIAIVRLNQYFKTVPPYEKKPLIVSAYPPYFVDFFSNGNYNLLPLAPEQEFRDKKSLTWGPNDYSDLIALYKKYINGDYDLFIQNSGLGNAAHLTGFYQTIKDNFKFIKVKDGCYDTCIIYKLELR